MTFLQGQNCLEVLSSMSGLFRGHVSRSGLFKRVTVVLRSCLQGQGYLDIMFTKSGLFRFPIFKVRIV